MEDNGLDEKREEMAELEEQLNEMTKGEFYGFCAKRGLETYTVTEIEKLLRKFPEIRDVLRKCIVEHKKFYESLFGTLTDEKFKNDVSIQNILKMLRRYGAIFSLAQWVKSH